MYLSTLLTSLPLPFEEAIARVAELGFTHVDVVALADRPEAHREALADSGLIVSCAAVGRDLPAGQTLDAEPVALRRAAVEQVKRQIADAAGLGATTCYLVPGLDTSSEGMMRFTEAVVLLAEYAGRRMVRLCVEHIPGRALPSVRSVLTWLSETRHPNLALLLDVGHCLISGEDPSTAAVGLGYIHLDDNDGVGDLHWPLLTGRLSETELTRFVAALKEAGYDGGLALELNPQNADPVAALRDGKALLERLMS